MRGRDDFEGDRGFRGREQRGRRPGSAESRDDFNIRGGAFRGEDFRGRIRGFRDRGQRGRYNVEFDHRPPRMNDFEYQMPRYYNQDFEQR